MFVWAEMDFRGVVCTRKRKMRKKMQSEHEMNGGIMKEERTVRRSKGRTERVSISVVKKGIEVDEKAGVVALLVE